MPVQDFSSNSQFRGDLADDYTGDFRIATASFLYSGEKLQPLSHNTSSSPLWPSQDVCKKGAESTIIT
jgi:hypothetical protein